MPPLPLHLATALPLPIANSEPVVATDRALVRAILDGGSESAFVELYQRHTPQLFRIARRLLGSTADAEDAVQETWIRAMRRIDSFQWRSALSTWLGAIVVNVAREQLQRDARWSVVELRDDIATAPARAPDLDLERAIALLPPGFRAAFVLHDVEGFTHEDIARQLGWTTGTSKSQLFRARRALRRVLGHPCQDRDP
ncbi:MAG TPA: sigma-70 family RNA polymerase sigma factor [Gemmatimonadaceae bacterium]|nr:sigma-70 family RNA polymerase sigma factor [Gemmatimonadaceae bacterium]